MFVLVFVMDVKAALTEVNGGYCAHGTLRHDLCSRESPAPHHVREEVRTVCLYVM